MTSVLRDDRACSMFDWASACQLAPSPRTWISGRWAEVGVSLQAKRVSPNQSQTVFLSVSSGIPLAWYESFYRYKSQEHINWERDGDAGNWNRWHPNSILNGLGEGKSFSEFVEAVLDCFPGYVSALYDYYTLPPVDFVGKQESLTEDLVEVLNRMGLHFDESLIRESAPVNASRGKEKQIDWDSELRDRVLRAEQAAIQRFGYDT